MRIFVLNVKIEIMTREDIEKARSNYIKELRDAKKLSNSAEIDIACNAFADGAEWRITSIWHNIKEIPNKEKTCIAWSPEYGTFICGCYKNDIEDMIEEFNVTKWAYIEDLLPTK